MTSTTEIMTNTMVGIEAAKRVLQMRTELPALHAVIAAAQKELVEALGYKKTIARQKLEAEKDTLVKFEAAILAEMAPDTESLEGRLIWRLVEYQLKRTPILKAMEQARDDVLLAEEQSGKNTWKRVGGGGGPSVPMRKAQEALEVAEKALKMLDANEDYKRAVDWCEAEIRFERRQMAFDVWRKGGPAPDFVIAEREAAEKARWSGPGIVVLKLGKKVT